MNISDEWSELIVVVIIAGVFIVLGATVFTQYLDKARLTVGVAAMNQVQEDLKSYHDRHHAYPRQLDFSDCSDQARNVVFSCDAIKSDIDSFVSYDGGVDTFILKIKAKDAARTLVKVTESTITY